MTVYSGWSQSIYVSSSKRKHIERWELDNFFDDGVFNFDMVVADIKELVGDTSKLTIREIEVSIERQATSEELEAREAENKQRELDYDIARIKNLRETYGDNPYQWPGMG